MKIPLGAYTPNSAAVPLDNLLAIDPAIGRTPFAWLKAIPSSPKADHVRELIDRLQLVRNIGLSPETGSQVHDARRRQFVREGHIADAIS